MADTFSAEDYHQDYIETTGRAATSRIPGPPSKRARDTQSSDQPATP